MEVFLIRALQLILCFALLILLHEGGHFLFAKLFKVRVEKFCLFFDPWFTLFKFKPRNSDTTYGIGWLPLGGYVKISGHSKYLQTRENKGGVIASEAKAVRDYVPETEPIAMFHRRRETYCGLGGGETKTWPYLVIFK